MVFHNNNSLFCEILPSLPSRERGLKLVMVSAGKALVVSLPSRERGLKLVMVSAVKALVVSLPSRERGLKFFSTWVMNWLEIVAPFAGAWIEIQKLTGLVESMKSLPSRERELKLNSWLTV